MLNSREQGNIAPPAIHDATTRLKQLHSDAGNSTDENLILKTWDGNDSSHTTRQKLERATGPSPMSITSHTKTNVQLISPRGHIQVGDIIKYRIQTRDSEGRDRVIGGDFWYATLNSANPQASTAGYVADYNNGTYEVTFLAAWAGQAEFKLILVHPSEAVNHLRNVVWPAEERVIWNGYFKHKNKKEETTTCFLRSSRPWTGLCQYPSHNALGKTILVCQKPKELSCDDFTSYNTNWDKCNQTVNKLTQGVQYLFKRYVKASYNLPFRAIDCASLARTGTRKHDKRKTLFFMKSNLCFKLIFMPNLNNKNTHKSLFKLVLAFKRNN